jgi:hypothetical protein
MKLTITTQFACKVLIAAYSFFVKRYRNPIVKIVAFVPNENSGPANRIN